MKLVTKVIRSGLTIIFSILLIFIQCSVVLDAEEKTTEAEVIEEPEDLYALSAVLMDAGSGRILFSKNGQEERAMASTTKIMTCILALENGSLDDIVTVSEYAASQPEVHLGVHAGQKFILGDLLYSMMLESHNDSAVIIAETIGKSVEGFAEIMNEKARSLGCENTYFITPNGLDASDENGIHHTNAEDLAKIMKYCIMDSSQKEMFLKITQTQEYSFTEYEGNRSYTCINRNAFLKMMNGALSGKTGFTNEAGYCYVGALENEGRTFIVTLLACGWPNNKGYKWADTRKLMKYGMENFHYRNVYQEIRLSYINIINGIPDSDTLNGRSTISAKVNIPSEISETKELNILLRDDEKINIIIEQEETLFAPVKQGDVVGNVKYTLKENEIVSWEIVAGESKKVRDISWCARQVLFRYLI